METAKPSSGDFYKPKRIESSMKTYIGIWMDRRKAIVVTLHQPENVEEPALQTKIAEISSGVEKRVRTAGGSRTAKTPWGPHQAVSESKTEARHQSQLKHYYTNLVTLLAKAHRILIMGPGEAKNGLMKLIAENPSLAAHVAGVETSDKMTPRQIAARASAYFQL